MGYAATTVVVLGVALGHGESKQLADAIQSKLTPLGHDIEEMELNEILDVLGYPAPLLEATWAADQADSRSSDTDMFRERDRMGEYALGLMVGSKGYGCNDDVPSAIASCQRPDWQAAFASSVGALVFDMIGEQVEPEVLVINQVW